MEITEITKEFGMNGLTFREYLDSNKPSEYGKKNVYQSLKNSIIMDT